jgi:Tfp pilus assembly protein PilN
MNTKFLNNLSLLKTAGIKKILAVDIFNDYLKLTFLIRKEKLFNISNDTLLENIYVSSVEKIEFENDLNSIHDLLLSWLALNKLENVHILVGINECQYQKINVPVDVEDDELWFLENSEKFLPEGRSSNEFSFSYQKIKEDEFARSYLAAITRKDYIDKIVLAFSFPEFEILGIMPFLSSFVLNKELQNSNRLLLIFLINKLQYAFVNESGSFELGELYYNNPDDPNDISGILLNNIYTLDQMLVKSDKPLDGLTIITSAPTGLEEPIRGLIYENLSVKINFYNTKMESQAIPSALTLTALFENFESRINFLPTDLSLAGSSKIEKRIFLNSVFICGGVVLILLLLSNLFSLYSQKAQSERDEETVTLDQQQNMLKKLKEGNDNLKANISMMNKLKNKKSAYSSLMLLLNKITDEDCCLTGVEIKNNNNYMNLNITGVAYSQGNVSDLIKKMESLNQFKDISLVYSSSVSTDELSLAVKLNTKRVVQFNIKSGYYEN